MVTRRQFIKQCASTLLAVSAGSLMQIPVAGAPSSREIPVLLYHRIGYTKGHMTVTPERFTEDLATLSNKGYKTVALPVF